MSLNTLWWLEHIYSFKVQTARFLSRGEISIFPSSRFFYTGKELAGKVLFSGKGYATSYRTNPSFQTPTTHIERKTSDSQESGLKILGIKHVCLIIAFDVFFCRWISFSVSGSKFYIYKSPREGSDHTNVTQYFLTTSLKLFATKPYMRELQWLHKSILTGSLIDSCSASHLSQTAEQ